jgi:hypothetical protein
MTAGLTAPSLKGFFADRSFFGPILAIFKQIKRSAETEPSNDFD